VARDGGADAVDFGEIQARSKDHSSAPKLVMARRSW
jgi:hypothetical protein